MTSTFTIINDTVEDIWIRVSYELQALEITTAVFGTLAAVSSAGKKNAFGAGSKAAVAVKSGASIKGIPAKERCETSRHPEEFKKIKGAFPVHHLKSGKYVTIHNIPTLSYNIQIDESTPQNENKTTSGNINRKGL